MTAVDVKAIFARHARLDDTYAERSLIAAILFDQRALDRLPELEVDDFADVDLRLLFMAIRNVQAHGADVDASTVLDEIARSDRERGTHGHARLWTCLVETMHRRIATDFAPDEVRWYFDRVRACRARRERFAA